MATKKEDQPKSYFVQITREGVILASLVIPADQLWPEVVTLFGKACISLIALDTYPSFPTRITIDVRPIK